MLLKTPEDIRNLLMHARTIAVVGVSDKADRPSHGVARYLMERTTYTVWLVNPLLSRIGDHTVYPSLAELPGVPDIVDVFRRLDDVPEVLEHAIAIGAPSIWLQLGLSSDTVAQRATDAGMDIVMDRCIKVDHQHLLA